MNPYIVIAILVIAIIALAVYVMRDKYPVVTPVVPPVIVPPVVIDTMPGSLPPAPGDDVHVLTDAELIASDPRWDLTRPKKD